MRQVRVLAGAAALVLLVLVAGCGQTGSTAGGGGSGRPLPSLPGSPIGAPAAGDVGSQGGSIASADGFFLVEVPAGALPGSTAITIQQVTNLAPGGVGASWKLGPEGVVFARPAALTLYAGAAGRPLDELTVAYQDDQGYWHRVPPAEVATDQAAKTLTVQTSHFSSWTLTTAPTVRDLTGPFTITSVLGTPVSTPGTATYTFAGEDALGQYYVSSGTISLPSYPSGTATCTVTPPETADLPLRTNIAELSKATPATFAWGASGHWNVTCIDNGSGAITSALVTVGFDTQGINLVGCGLAASTEVSGSNASVGAFTWDCSSKGRGQVSASWNYQSAACGTKCFPVNPCKTGTVLCDTGVAVCTEDGDLANGALCGAVGANLVCNAGACVTCTADVPCAGNPTLCASGVTSCATGASVCVDKAPLTSQPDGTTCGNGQVCSSGTCVTCAADVPCSTNPTVCSTGVTSCATGSSLCIDASPLTPVANGTFCGAGQVCNAGACVACASGLPCSGNPNSCAAGVTSCLTGTSTCVDGTQLPDGSACGSGTSCSAGTCVASRTVSGTRLVTWWPDAGAQPEVVAPDVVAGSASVRAWRQSGATWGSFPGTFDPATGAFSIPGVPLGAYLLQFTDGSGAVSVVAGVGDTMDLGYGALGRSDQVPATAFTPVTLTLAGLAPWTVTDQLQITASNADGWDTLASSAIVAGDVGANPIEDWSARNAGGPALSLLAPSDLLYVHQLAARTDATSTLPYQAASGWTSVTGTALVSGSPATLVPAAFTALTPATGSLPAATWNLSSFEILVTGMSGSATTSPLHTLSVGASVGDLSAAGPTNRGTPSLLRMEVAGGTTPDPTLGALGYGQFLAPLWREWLGVDFTATATYVGPGSPAPTPLSVPVSVGQRDALPTASALRPALSPVQAPVIVSSAGSPASAFSTLTGLGLTPSFSWTTPSTGVPTRYTVDVYRLGAADGATTATRVSSLTTTGTSVPVPPNTLVAGSIYFARITAWAFAPDPLSGTPPAPFRRPSVYSRAETLTGTFSP
jgi:hypothetical protein